MKYVDLSSVGERFVSEYESVVESLKRLLFSEPDEWVNKPGYGLGLNFFLEEGPDQAYLLSEVIKSAVRRWEPRVEVTEVLSVFEDDELKIKVNFWVPEYSKGGSVEMGVTK